MSIDITKSVTAQFTRLGCTGQRATINVAPSEGSGGYVNVWCPEYDPDCTEPAEVDPEFLSELLAYLPAEAPIGECEGAEGEPSVWDVILGLASDGYRRTAKWLRDDLGLAKVG